MPKRRVLGIVFCGVLMGRRQRTMQFVIDFVPVLPCDAAGCVGSS